MKPTAFFNLLSVWIHEKTIMLCRKEDTVGYIIHLVYQQLISVGPKDQLYLTMEEKIELPN